jgi:hypothetical protein
MDVSQPAICKCSHDIGCDQVKRREALGLSVGLVIQYSSLSFFLEILGIPGDYKSTAARQRSRTPIFTFNSPKPEGYL